MTLQAGDKAPAFTLPDQNGKNHALEDYKGKWVLLYFYPKDMTPGCTVEACTLRDEHPAFQKLDAVVLGVSADSASRHEKFIEKYDLPFTLLSDEDKKMLNDYGVWAKKTLAGREYMGILRQSYLIDPKGKIRKVYHKVKPKEHAGEVLSDLEDLR